jgi:hypothetical protein
MKKDLLFFFFLRHLLGFLENWNRGMDRASGVGGR